MRRLGLATLLLALLTVVAGPSWADAGDRTVRFGLAYVSPTGEGRVEQSRRETFGSTVEDLRTVDLNTLFDVRADTGAGVNFGIEFLLTRNLGLEVNLGYSQFDVALDVGGELTVTPWKPDPNNPNTAPPVPDPDNAERAEVAGKQSGQLAALPLTVGLNFYVVRARSLDFYIGPLIGIVFFSDLDLDQGTLEAEPPLWPIEDAVAPTAVEIKESPTLGVATGVDVWLGGGGWLLSIAARYLQVDARVQRGLQQSVPLDPWSVQAGVGYRF